MRPVSDAQSPYGHPGPPPPVPPYRPAPPPPTYSSPAPAADYRPAGPTAAPPYAAPYIAPKHPQYAAAVTYSAPPSRTLGIVALVLALVALVVSPLVAGIAAFRVGLGTGREVALLPAAAEWDWALLSPVRDWVLLGEIAFWAGTVLGTWALVQGIVAIARRRGRGLGIAAVVISVVALGAFVVGGWTALFVGLASGASIGA